MLRRRAYLSLVVACVALVARTSAQERACPVRLGCPTCLDEAPAKTAIIQAAAFSPCTNPPAPCATGGCTTRGCTTGACATSCDGGSCNNFRTWSLFMSRKVAPCEVCTTKSCGTSGGCGCATPSCGCQTSAAKACSPRPFLDFLTRLTGRERPCSAPTCGTSSCHALFGDLGIRQATGIVPASPAPPSVAPRCTEPSWHSTTTPAAPLGGVTSWQATVPALGIVPATPDRLPLPGFSEENRGN